MVFLVVVAAAAATAQIVGPLRVQRFHRLMVVRQQLPGWWCVSFALCCFVGVLAVVVVVVGVGWCMSRVVVVECHVQGWWCCSFLLLRQTTSTTTFARPFLLLQIHSNRW